jgi:hypothetical protein
MSAAQKPQGFYRLVTASGDSPLAFTCHKCCLEFTCAPTRILHCGGWETFDPVRDQQIARVRLNPSFVVLD